MIDTNDIPHCDFCEVTDGIFSIDTGNHLVCEAEALRERVKVLEAALLKYGAHLRMHFWNQPCDCGFHAILATIDGVDLSNDPQPEPPTPELTPYQRKQIENAEPPSGLQGKK